MRTAVRLTAASYPEPALDLYYASTMALNVAYEQFSRASIGYFYNSSGVLAAAPQNICLQSQTLDNASWGKSSASVTANAAAAPDGTTTADKLVEAAANAAHSTDQTISIAAGSTITFSVYAKSAERTFLQINLGNAGDVAYLRFNLGTGAFLQTAIVNSGTNFTVPSSTGTAVGGAGWYRITFTLTTAVVTSINVACYLYNAASTYLGDGTSGLYLWGAQLEVASAATSYIPTTSTALYGPRFDYDPSSPRKNLLLRSQDLSNATWGSGGGGLATVTSGVVTAPDGSTAYTLSDASTSLVLGLLQSVAVPSGTTTAYTCSAHVKAGTSSVVSMRAVLANGTTVVGEVVVDLTTGAAQWRTATTGTSFSVNYFGDGWYRIAVTITNNGTANTALSLELRSAFAATYSPTLDVTATGTAHFWGIQAEAASATTAYIPTTSAAVSVYTPRGLLMEPARTNLFINSGEVGSWATLGDATITANSAVAPDNTTTGDLVTMGASGTVPGQGCTLAAATTYSVSIYVKDGATSPWLRCRIVTAAGSVSAYFDLATYAVGSLGAGMSGGRVEVIAATGWRRYSFQYLPAAGDEGSRSHSFSGVSANGGATASGAFTAWGVQVEAGVYTSSYIPTAGSTVNRAIDTCSVPTASIPSWSATEGTVAIVTARFGLAGFGRVLQFDDGTANNAMLILGAAAGNTRVYAVIGTGGVTQVDTNAAQNNLTLYTMFGAALAWKLDDSAFAFRGGSVTVDNVCTMPTVDTMRIGLSNGSSASGDCWIERVSYHASRLENVSVNRLSSRVPV